MSKLVSQKTRIYEIAMRDDSILSNNSVGGKFFYELLTLHAQKQFINEV